MKYALILFLVAASPLHLHARMPFAGPEDDQGSEAACLKDPYVKALWESSLGFGKGDISVDLEQKRREAFDRTTTKSQAFTLSRCLGVVTREAHKMRLGYENHKFDAPGEPGDFSKEIERLYKIKNAALDAEIAINNKFQLTLDPHAGLENASK